ncbi:MAG: aminotransferase class I/II-fold pyridoxal phosphate-dependent enzyme [Deltaproteobacteria bacterium]|nr:aminotransferase class I/II-fold pyridoxal phosphate-dependent enzyme [Deltaproteobacteria bacterium]
MKPEPFRLERYFAAHEFSAPYLLSCSDCESMTIDDLLGMQPNAQEQFLSLWLGYTESAGSPVLREAIAGLYAKLSRDHILVHAGAEEAIFNFMNVVLEAGDQMLVHTPYYQSLGEIARSIGAEVIEWIGDVDHGWALDLNFLKNHLSQKTRLVAINFPHNPTGFLPDISFMSELSKLSTEYGFLIFSDEVYRGLEYSSTHRLPAFTDLNERAVSLGVMSKAYGLPGLRIGWIATRNQALYDKLAAFKDYTTICNSAPSEFLAVLALNHREAIANRNLGIIRSNLELLNAFFDMHADLFQWHQPKAGPIAFPRYLGGAVESFCDDLLEQAGVLLVPGSCYRQGGDCFRVGFGRRNMPECLDCFEEYLNKKFNM